ncbi:UV-stimulated scaffold protein A [Sorex araneus]|uniref:UV-stimulated scaffold protein A n=1 Tax=Sorex araneus TaxID=42254 RepID=UPI002433B97A|nr:UV-stimulated scaffold protein A [Sorex araneus]
MAQRLPELVEELTTSGEPQLNAGKMQELKKLCKSSVEQLGHTYHLLKAQLSQEHAQVRLSTFQVMEQLFTRSHHFRTLLVSDFQEFLELTLGTDHSQPLPPPREVAQRLRQAALQAVKDWTAQYGAAYKKLDLGYHFLRHSKQVDFQDMDARTPAERRRDEARQRRLDLIHQDRAQQAAGRMEEMSTEIQCCLTELDSCFELLLPFDLTEASHMAENKLEPQEEEQPCCSRSLSEAEHPPPGPGASSEDEDSDQNEFVRCHGLGSHKYTLQVDLSSDGLRVQEDEDNVAIIHSARDALKLIQNKFLPAVCSWVQVFTRAGVQGGPLQKAISLKVELEKALRRGRELAIEPLGPRQHQTAATGDTDEDDDDEDFVEVLEKEGYEAHIPDHLWAEYGLEEKSGAQGSAARTRTSREEEEACDPTTAAAQLHHRPRHQPSTPRALGLPPASPQPEEAGKQAEWARAPVVPFGVDLCYWGQEQPSVGKILRADSEHRFWKPSEVEPEVDSATVAETLRTRRITFAGTFEPVQHRCRAPRPDGRLCERQDRLKCPFHGKIIPRDDTGQPLCEEDRVREQQQQLQRQAERPDWKDPAFLRDVEAAIGVDLGSSRCGKGKGKSRKRKHPGLTDLRQQTNTPRARIAKKVFAKAAMQRVVAAMNQMDQKKHEKFANQFNYALK